MNRATALSALALVASAGLLVAGPLTPPGGPVASSYKTLSEVEPRIALSPVNTPGDVSTLYRITQPGSYYLTGNIAVNFKTGVSIETSGVTLDLNGFEIFDVNPQVGSTRYGVLILGTVGNVCVRNGSIRNTNSDGIHDQGAASRFEDLSFYFCRARGLFSNKSPVVSSCTAYACIDDGFALTGGTVTGCASNAGDGSGFAFFGGTIAVECTAKENAGSGFEATTGVISRCSAEANTYGFRLNGTELTASSASNNNSGAVRLDTGCSVRDCRFDGTTAFPIVVITGFNNLVEGNTTRLGSYGVQVSGGGNSNIIVRNFFMIPSAGSVLSGPTDAVGPMITTGGAVASTNPWANFVR